MNTKKRDDGTDADDVIGSDVVLSLNPRVTILSGGDDSGRVHTPSVSTNSTGGIALSTLRSEERELLGLADGRRSVEELARLSTMSPQSVRKHLRSLRDRGVLIQRSDGHRPDGLRSEEEVAQPVKSDLDIPDPADERESEDPGDGSTALTRAIDEYLELAANALHSAAAAEESSRPTVALSAVDDNDQVAGHLVGGHIVGGTNGGGTNDLTDKVGPPAGLTAAPAGESTGASHASLTETTAAGLGSVPMVEQPSVKSGSQAAKSNVTQFWIPSMGDLVGSAPVTTGEPPSKETATAKESEASGGDAIPVDSGWSGSSPSSSTPSSSGPTVIVTGSGPKAVPVAEGPRAFPTTRAAPAGPATPPKSAAISHPVGGGVEAAAGPGPSPFRVGAYEVATRIAQGGMGSIYVCRRAGESGVGRLFTLKVVRQHSNQREEAVQSFKREAHIGSLLNHPNLQTVLDVGSYRDQPFLVLDYVEGTNLSDLIADDRRAPVPVIVAVLLDILRGLEYAHELVDDKGARLGLVHGDVSPQNVLVGVDGAARLTDFGSATFTGEGRIHDPKWIATGKPAYMAPEQLRAEPLDARTDVFAVGILMWSALTGQNLFSGESYDETIMKVLKKKIPAPSAFGAPAFLDEVCLKALSRARDGRYATAEEMARDLQRVAAAENSIASMAELGQWVRRESGEGLAEQRRRIQLMFGSSKVPPAAVRTPSVTTSPAATMVMQSRQDFQTPRLGQNKALPSRTVVLPAVHKSKASETFWQTWKVVIVSALLALPVTLTIGYFIYNFLVSQSAAPARSVSPSSFDAASPR